MDESNINDFLPWELLANVFKLLEPKDLKKATLTCKWWNEIIESECRWPLRLTYDWNYGLSNNSSCNTTEQKMNFILTTNRRFGTIEIINGRFGEGSQIMKMFERHGSNVLRLTLLYGRIKSLTAFAELLGLTPKLEHVEMRNVKLRTLRLDHAIPDLKRMKHLEIEDSNLRFIKCFRKAQLKTIRFGAPKTDAKHYDTLADFISSQVMLTSLTAYNGDILFEIGKFSIPFRLTKLAIAFVEDRDPSYDHDNFIKFLTSQAESLKQVELGYDVPSTVYEFVFAKMPKLDTLILNVEEILSDDELSEQLDKNLSVRTIRLDEYYYGLDKDDVEMLRDFLRKLPNIRNLSLTYIDRDVTESFVDVVEETLTEVETLHVDIVEETTVYPIFSNLKVLRIGVLNAKINWNIFTEIHYRLTELTISTINGSCFTSDDIDQMTTNTDLQIIRLGAGFVADAPFFEIVRRKCKSLKVLDLHKSCLSDGVSHNMSSNVLRLYDDIVCSPKFSS